MQMIILWHIVPIVSICFRGRIVQFREIQAVYKIGDVSGSSRMFLIRLSRKSIYGIILQPVKEVNV